MNSIPLFSGEISLYDDADTGLRVECSEKHVLAIAAHLKADGFRCGAPSIEIHGTKGIHNFVSLPVQGSSFDSMKNSVVSLLNAAGVTHAEESFNIPGESHVRIYTTNVSVFDK